MLVGKRGIGLKEKEGDLLLQKVNIKLSIFYIEKIELKNSI